MKLIRVDPLTVIPSSFPPFKSTPERFHSYTQMNLDTLNYILKKVESKLNKP